MAKIRTLDFLPTIFRTPVNEQFLSATLDQIVQQPDLERIQGYVGSKFGYGLRSNSNYVVEPTKTRTNYQLDPGVVFTSDESSEARDFISYPEIIDAIQLEGGITSNHNRLFTGQYYSWDSLINLDMLVNYNQYYWLQDGPDAVSVTGNGTTIIVASEILGKKTYTTPNGVVFTNGLKIQFDAGVFPADYANNQYYVEGVGNSIQLIPVKELVAPEVFTQDIFIPWDIKPWDTTVWDTRLFVPVFQDYITINRSSIDRNGWSRSNMWYHIDVIKATGKYNGDVDYVNNNATAANKATRPIIEFYPNMRLFNSGVIGKAAIDFFDTRAQNAFSEIAGKSVYYPDVEVYTKSYPSGTTTIDASVTGGFITSTTITVPTVDITGTFVVGQFIRDDGQVLPLDAQIVSIATVGSNTVIAAEWGSVNPILAPVTNTSVVANKRPSGQYLLFDGARIVFANDTDPNVRNKIYVARVSGVAGGSSVYTLSVATDGNVAADSQTVVITGYNYYGKNFKFDGSNWTNAQQKVAINQEPLFNVYDNSNVSYGDTTLYPSSTFVGSKLFAYARGTGTNDAVLGFPLKYNSLNNVGDIVFDVPFNSDTFTWQNGAIVEKQSINDGYVHSYTTYTSYNRLMGWQTGAAQSQQYQIFIGSYTTGSTPQYTCDIPALTSATTGWPSVKFYIDNVQQAYSDYTVVTSATNTTITFKDPGADCTIQVAVLSSAVSQTAYYDTPLNLDSNPFNANISSASTADIRDAYSSIFYNAPGTSGPVLGANNYRDLGNLVPWGAKIIKNSGSLVLPAALLRKNVHSLYNALKFNANEYVAFKTLLLNTAYNMPYDMVHTGSTVLEDALDQITSNKNESDAFFWSDMLPSKQAYAENTYLFNSTLSSTTYQLSKIYDYTAANYSGVLLYRTTSAGITTQLLRGVDYTVSDIAPEVSVTTTVNFGDTITVREYNQTYGSYVPNTPTKLGLYPATIPSIIVDSAYGTPTTFIVGHDGSYTKLYGNYDAATGTLDDIRDVVLYEFECRVYNNLKLPATLPINIYDTLPGYWRSTEYNYDEFTYMYAPGFLNWLGANNLSDWTRQYYDEANEFTWNYRDTGNRLNNSALQQGYWRGIYLYLYDSANPDTRPWELLQYANKPAWWDGYYGTGPYTSDNTVLWTDLAAGYDWNNGTPRTVTRAVRPDLLRALPVDSFGALVSPFNSIVGNYTIDYRVNRAFRASWNIGDVGPTELAYRRSSTWPYDLTRIISLQHPSLFYNAAVDIDNYRYNSEFNAYMSGSRPGVAPQNIEVYGNGTAKTSYLNLIVDYEKQYGIDATDDIETLLRNLDVRLVYRLAGFSDTRLLKLYIEKSSPNSVSSSLLISDDSYGILLHDNAPFDRIIYSGVVVQYTGSGYRIDGYSNAVASFPTLRPVQNGNTTAVTVEGLTARVAVDYSTVVEYVPYGTLFYNVYDLSQFLASYGQYLQTRGMQFNDQEGPIEITWTQMVAEFLYWAQSGWSTGSIVTLNPSAKSLTIDRDSYIVQPLTIKGSSYILNQNMYPIQSSNTAILRQGTLFNVKPLQDGDTLAYGQFNIHNFEHGIVLDNSTQFNDKIYDLVTGTRQYRIVVRGSKTATWTGSVDAAGFILNQDNVVEWNKNVIYSPGEIVRYKGRYWTATRIIQPSDTFDQNTWVLTDYQLIKRGLLPNASTAAYESTLYYDINQANLEVDADMLAFSLIGFRPRDYMAAADLTDITQVNVYEHLIGLKGTLLGADLFQNVQLSSGTTSYKVYENWIIKAGNFGGVLNSNFVDIRLVGSNITGNPSIVQLVDGTIGYDSNSDIDQRTELADLYNWNRRPTSPFILSADTDVYPRVYLDAGYVSYDDVKYWAYNYAALGARGAILQTLYVGDYLWIADIGSTWQVYQPVSVGFTTGTPPQGGVVLTTATNNLNGTVTLRFNAPHGLQKYELIGIVSFNSEVNGFYLINTVLDDRRVVIDLTLDNSTKSVTGTGTVLRFESHRVATPSQVSSLSLLSSEFRKNRVWVDLGPTGSWEVLLKSINYKHASDISLPAGSSYGTAVAAGTTLGLVVSDPGTGILRRYTGTTASTLAQSIAGAIGFGSTIAHNGTLYAVGNSLTGDVTVYCLQVDSVNNLLTPVATIAATECSSIAISGDGRWLFVGDTTTNTVRSYTGGAEFVGDVNGAIATAILSGTTLSINAITSGTISIGDTVSGTASASTAAFNLIVGQTYTITFAGTTNWTAVGSGSSAVGTVFVATATGSGTGLAAATLDPTTVITALGTGTGGVGTYTVTPSQFVGTGTYTLKGTTLTVTQLNSGLITVGSTLCGTGVTPGTTITAQLTGVGGTGTYTVSAAQYTPTATLQAVAYSAGPTLTGASFQVVPVIGDDWSASLATDWSASVLHVGAPMQDQPSIADWGRGYTFTRTQQRYEVTVAGAQTITLEWTGATTGTVLVSVNGTALVGTYTVIAGILLISSSLNVGDIVVIESQNWVPAAEYSSSAAPRTGFEFGRSVATSKYGTELLWGVPYYLDDANNEGAVYRYINAGRITGTSVGTTPTSLTTTRRMLINGYPVQLNGATFIGQVNDAVFTGYINGAMFTGSVAGTVLTVTQVQFGYIVPGTGLSGTGVTAGTTITSQATGAAGGIGTYNLSVASTVASSALTSAGTILNVTSMISGTIVTGQTISGTGVTPGTVIVAASTGTGGTGMYIVDTVQDVASTTISSAGTTLTVTQRISGRIAVGQTLSTGATVTALGTGTGGTGTYTLSIPQNIASSTITALPTVGWTATDVAADIVSQGINNITASASAGILTIALKNTSISTPGNLLTCTTPDYVTALELGLQQYTQHEIILPPHSGSSTSYGYALKFNEWDSFVVGAPTDTRYSSTTFDWTDDEDNDNDTVFDNNATQFREEYASKGAIHMYDRLKVYNESVATPAAYVYAQSVNSQITTGVLPLYGKSVDMWNWAAAGGAPGEQSATILLNSTGVADWTANRVSSTVIDINRMSGTQLYSAANSETIAYLDYIDPLGGKLLGVVEQNLDYISDTDPAGYNSTKTASLVWGEDQVGMLWFDTSRTRWVNCHQNDVSYNSRNWGTAFPGSEPAVYTWCSSEQPPSGYTGPGKPRDLKSGALHWQDTPSGSLVAKYYFWVRNTDLVSTQRGKTLSDTVLEAYIATPRSTGIPFVAPLNRNTVGLYNVAGDIQGNDTVLHLGFSTGTNNDVMHVQYDMIRADYKDDFLSGIPGTGGEPTGLYAKFIDSLSGLDSLLQAVPDPTLPIMLQTGVQIRPRQSFYRNRLLAVENYLRYANTILATTPIRETKEPIFLDYSGVGYSVNQYWSYVNWWATGYTDATKANTQVQFFYQLANITPYVGQIAKVTTNDQGMVEWYVYSAAGTWVRIGLEKGTIQFSSALWDSARTAFPQIETRWIVRALNEQIYTEDLLIYRNRALIEQFAYIQSEAHESQNYLPWLNKTSFVDVDNNVAELTASQVYQNDNQEFLTGYINEVKPFHVVIKDFLIKYSRKDAVGVYMTDFDLPSKYVTSAGQYVTPQLVDGPSTLAPSQFLKTDTIWSDPDYVNWFNEYGYAFEGDSAYPIATLASTVYTNSTTIFVNNPRAFPVIGTITIGTETITYTAINRSTGELSGLSRGANGTSLSEHAGGTTVYIDMPAVVVYQSGRGYTAAPTVTVTLDLSLYPAPRRVATMTATLSNTAVTQISVTDVGSGYMVDPTITVAPATTIDWTPADVNVATGVWTITSSVLQTGDIVQYVVPTGSTAITNMPADTYYYVGVLTTAPVTLALYQTIDDALLDLNRIIPATTGAGTQQFTFGAIVGIAHVRSRVREMKIGLGFDRVTYVARPDWVSGTTYGAAYPNATSMADRPVVKVLSVTGVNPAVLTLDLGWSANLITSAQLNRAPFYYLNPGLNKRICYLKATSANTVEAYLDYDLTYGVPAALFATPQYNSVVGTVGPSGSAFVGYIYGDTITASIAGTTMTVTAALNSVLQPGDLVTGTGVAPNTTIISGAGGVGTYTVSPSQTVASTAMSTSGTTLVITAVTGGSLNVGDTVTGPGIQPNTVILAQLTGVAGGTGTYSITPAQVVGSAGSTVAVTVVSRTITLTGGTAFTGYIDDNSTPGVYSGVAGAILTVQAMINGAITIGTTLSGVGIAPNTVVTGFISGTGGIGTYNVGVAQAYPSTTIAALAQFSPGTPLAFTASGQITASISGSNMTVTAAPTGTLVTGYTLLSSTVASNTVVQYQITPLQFGETLGGIGRYVVSGSQVVPSSVILVRASTEVQLYDAYYVENILGTALTVTNPGSTFTTSSSVTLNWGTGYLSSVLPLSCPADRVLYNGALWECTTGNSDTAFDFTKWIKVAMTAPDRIMSLYQPTASMPGRDLTQLMSGATNPLVTYGGSIFNPSFAVDTIIQDYDWARLPGTPINTIKGATFSTGYGPEEMIAGLTSDLCCITVISNDAVLSFRITVDKGGYSSVHNINPYTQTTLSVAHTRVNDAGDTMTVADITKIVELDVRNNPLDPELTSDATGTCTINGVDVRRILQVQVSAGSWQMVDDDTIKITGLAPNTVAAVTVTFAYGRLMYIQREFIGFTSCDVDVITAVSPTPGTLIGLYRGVLGSTINTTIAAGTIVQSVLDRDSIPNVATAYLAQNWWYGDPSTVAAATTLATNTAPAAVILQRVV